jgi:hypothetical protein
MFFVFMRAYLSLVRRPNKHITTEVPVILSEAKNPRSFGVGELQRFFASLSMTDVVDLCSLCGESFCYAFSSPAYLVINFLWP